MKNLRLAGVAAVLLTTWGLSAFAQDSARQRQPAHADRIRKNCRKEDLF
jgi:hypothetical protein